MSWEYCDRQYLSPFSFYKTNLKKSDRDLPLSVARSSAHRFEHRLPSLNEQEVIIYKDAKFHTKSS